MQETQTFSGRSAGSWNRFKCDRMAGFIARARSGLKMKGKWTVGKAWSRIQQSGAVYPGSAV